MVDREKCRYKLIYLVILTNLDNPVISIISNHGKDGVSSSSLEVGSMNPVTARFRKGRDLAVFYAFFPSTARQPHPCVASFVCEFPT